MLTKLKRSFLEKILISISVQSFEPLGVGRKFKVICTLTLRPVLKGKFAIYKLKVNKINSLKYKAKLFGIKHHQCSIKYLNYSIVDHFSTISNLW